MTTPSCLLGYPELSRSPALSANKRPGLGVSDQSEAAVPGCCLARAGSNYLAGGGWDTGQVVMVHCAHPAWQLIQTHWDVRYFCVWWCGGTAFCNLITLWMIFAMICKDRISDPCCWIPRVVEMASQLSAQRDNNRRAIRWREWFFFYVYEFRGEKDRNKPGSQPERRKPAQVQSSLLRMWIGSIGITFEKFYP